MQTEKMWAILLHLSTNMWHKDDPVANSRRDDEGPIYRNFFYTDKST